MIGGPDVEAEAELLFGRYLQWDSLGGLLGVGEVLLVLASHAFTASCIPGKAKEALCPSGKLRFQ